MRIEVINVIVFIVGLLFGHVWYRGTRAAIYGGLPWPKAIVHVLFFMVLAVPMMLVGWSWWFISYGFYKGRQFADGAPPRE